MIKKLWIKWDGMEIECLCEEHNKKCVAKPGEDLKCKEYVAKFVEIDRTEEEAKRQIKDFGAAVKSFEREVQNKIKQMNKFKVR